MTDILNFSRNRCTAVEQLDDTTVRATCRLQDTQTEAFVEIMVQLPDFEIVSVTGKVPRGSEEDTQASTQPLQEVVGLRVGPGILKTIKGLVGDKGYCKQLVFMIEECCHGVILSFTKDVLLKAPKDKEKEKLFYSEMVKNNPRLYNRCAAFASGSPLVEDIDSPDPTGIDQK